MLKFVRTAERNMGYVISEDAAEQSTRIRFLDTTIEVSVPSNSLATLKEFPIGFRFMHRNQVNIIKSVNFQDRSVALIVQPPGAIIPRDAVLDTFHPARHLTFADMFNQTELPDLHTLDGPAPMHFQSMYNTLPIFEDTAIVLIKQGDDVIYHGQAQSMPSLPSLPAVLWNIYLCWEPITARREPCIPIYEITMHDTNWFTFGPRNYVLRTKTWQRDTTRHMSKTAALQAIFLALKCRQLSLHKIYITNRIAVTCSAISDSYITYADYKYYEANQYQPDSEAA